jgi:electron transfer flavoprotein beta subunit
VLTEDEQDINTRFLGFAVSPHEECAVEEAVRIVEDQGGTATVLTLGPPEAEEQLREALAMGIDEAVLLETVGGDWNAMAAARAIGAAVAPAMDSPEPYDLLLFGNESADSSGYQVSIRVARALGLPCVTGVKQLSFEAGKVVARREASGGWEIFEVPLPAVITIKEGINLPRYPSFRGKMAAKKKSLERHAPAHVQGGMQKIRLQNPVADEKGAEILGEGPGAAPGVVELLKQIGVLET